MTKKQPKYIDIIEHRCDIGEYNDILTIEMIMNVLPIFRYTVTSAGEEKEEDINDLIPVGLRRKLADYFNETLSKYKKELEKNIKDYLCQEQQ